jgi:hypothetical protein
MLWLLDRATKLTSPQGEKRKYSAMLADVRGGSNSEVSLLARHVRCTLKSRRRQAAPAWPSPANSSHGTHPELEATVAEESATDVA